jgi:hypothetical protein
MIYEYAVEPACLADWENFRYLTENFGVSHGRLVSKFPSDWAKRVIEEINANKHSYIEGQQWIEELKRLKKHALIRSSRSYDGSREWVENALYQHEKGKPFHAIIVKDSSELPQYVLEVKRLSNSIPKWKTRRESRILRTAKELGKAVFLLLRMSNQIFFVDKLFAEQMTNNDNDRWLTTLSHFIHLATVNRDKPPVFEYHSEGKILSLPEMNEFKISCRNHLAKLLPLGTNLKLKLWTEWCSGKDFFHGRYILTDRGGVRIDWGLDQSKYGEKTEQRTDVTLLDEDMWKETWELFQADAKSFQFLDCIEINGN